MSRQRAWHPRPVRHGGGAPTADNAVEEELDPVRRRQAAHTFVAVMLDEANARRFVGEVPDLEGAAEIVSRALQPVG